jgi:prophage antirepressor-like protein
MVYNEVAFWRAPVVKSQAHENRRFDDYEVQKSAMDKGEIVLYKPQSDGVAIDVLIESETVWLTQAQMAELFETAKSNVSMHITNAFKDGELEKDTVVKKFRISEFNKKPTNFYNLDVIISVGYRVKSQRGVQFRRWATQVLKEYILRGYAIDHRIERLETQMSETVDRVTETEKKIEFFIRTALPPVEGVFFDGEIFDAYTFAADLIKKAKKRVVLLDNYIDETVLLLLSKRKAAVTAEIYTRKVSKQLQLDLIRHNAQYAPITVHTTAVLHDRFLIIDNTVYHIGASLKDLGKKLFAFSKMEMKPSELLRKV